MPGYCRVVPSVSQSLGSADFVIIEAAQKILTSAKSFLNKVKIACLYFMLRRFQYFANCKI
jgi:hypothetical protein